MTDIYHRHKWDHINYLVGSGGGIKGLVHCGALHELNLPRMKGYAGTSAGSIVFSLLAIGYNTQELVEIVYELDFSKILEGGINKLTLPYYLYENFGDISGCYLYNILGEYIEKKTNNKDYTINQLYQDQNIILIIVTTNLTRCREERFGPGINGDIPIRLAIRMSTSVPGLFKPVIYNNCYYVDGGLVNNYPVNVFEEYSEETLGLRIISETDNELLYGEKHIAINSFVDFIGANIEACMLLQYKKQLLGNYNIDLITPDYSLTDFNFSKMQKDQLLMIGRESVRN